MSFVRTSFFALSVAVLGVSPAKAGVWDSVDACSGTFCTDEYKKMGALSKINAENAYEAGFTGKGVTVAVIDSGALLTHQELAGKISPLQTAELNGKGVGSELEHGTHVSGIIAAAKDNVEMHGVAFDASVLALGAALSEELRTKDNPDTSISLSELADSKYDDIKIVSNSWGGENYLDGYKDNPEKAIKGERADWNAIQKLVAKDKLLVFAAGNEAWDYPGSPAWFPAASQETDVDALKLNMINVVSYNPYSDPSDSYFLADYSNLAKGAEVFSLAAPGGGADQGEEGIYSANSTGNADYVKFSGTSMATPVVSGVAALVQQAFPYMGGKQIADVLLSTANKSWESTSFANYYVSIWSNDEDDKEYTVTFRFTPNYSGNDEAKKKLIKSVVEEAQLGTVDDDLNVTSSGDKQYTIVYGDYQFSELFGAGFVDAAAAVKGLKTLDADRLRDTDYDTDKSQFLYTVDTKGFDSEWSNDIDEKKSSKSGYESASVGLKKNGLGRLILSGNNTFNGDTIVNGGVLDVRGTMNGAITVNANAELHLDDNATVNNNITSNGILSAAGNVTVLGGSVLITGGTLDLGTATLYANAVEFTDSADEKHLKIKINSSTEYGHFVSDVRFNTTADGVITTTLHINVDKAADLKTGDEFEFWNENNSDGFKSDSLKNTLYTFERVDDTYGKYRVTVTTNITDFMAAAGADAAQMQAAAAFTSGTFTNAKAEAFGQKLFEAAQQGASEQVKRMISSVMPDEHTVIQKAAVDNVAQLFSAVHNRIAAVAGGRTAGFGKLPASGSHGNSRGPSSFSGRGGNRSSGARRVFRGRSGGDNMTKAGVWGKYLYNYTHATDEFSGHSRGFVLGGDVTTENGNLFGIGYSRSETDVKSAADGRKTEMTANSALGYARLPVGSVAFDLSAGYTYNRANEKKMFSDDKHSAEQYSAQATASFGKSVIVPTAGARYIHMRNRAYTDSLDQHIGTTKADLLTGLAGFDFEAMAGHVGFSGELLATYDFLTDSDTVNVLLPNGAGYDVRAGRSHRFGGEASTALTVFLDSQISVAVEYTGAFKQDYQSHTGMVKLRCDF